ncbi:MAG TPA: hypothetical protein VHE35_37550 [Kofleriaceae bacterium]|nr:hypothetical protein [Kofleriaceae bacterium]
MSDFENEDAKAKEDVQPVVAPEVVEQVSPDQPAAMSTDEENVLWNLQVLDDGDYKLLAQVLANYPEYREDILREAVGYFGNDIIAKALAVLAGVPEPEAPSEQAAAPAGDATAQGGSDNAQDFDYTTSPLALEYDEDAKVRDHVDFMKANPAVADQVVNQAAEIDPNLATEVVLEYDAEQAQAPAPEQTEETPPQVIEETSKEVAEEKQAEQPQAEEGAQVSAQEAVEPQVVEEPEQESGWAVRAREFNADHADDVARFIAVTGGACMVDGALDPNLVAQWQARHGVEVDGRIDGATVEAAVKQQPQSFEEAAKEAEEENLPEPDPADPRFAL